jgi:16S rRNA C967 or C1407 C5-methylase (RsmB/RsmF family)
MNTTACTHRQPHLRVHPHRARACTGPSVVEHLRRQAVCTQIPWVPREAAWRCSNADYHNPEHVELKRWVQRTNGAGRLTFQEEVSMLPPLLLRVEPGSCVLDMCAAPGSKTLGVLEEMHSADDWGGAGAPRLATGVVLANDANAKRINNITLPRLKKLHSPCVVVTVANGAKMPLFECDPDGAPSSTDGHEAAFDRILVDAPCVAPALSLNTVTPTSTHCESLSHRHVSCLHMRVHMCTCTDKRTHARTRARAHTHTHTTQHPPPLPHHSRCSGDGTIRKEPEIWQKWTAKDGVEMHSLQLKLLTRGLALLRVGGRLVYSTCAFNPLENEAVVGAALAKYVHALTFTFTNTVRAFKGLLYCDDASSLPSRERNNRTVLLMRFIYRPVSISCDCGNLTRTTH